MVHKITTTSESIELQTTNTSTNTAGMTLPSTTSPPNFFKPFLRPSTSDISLSTDGGAADISTTAPSTPSHEDHHDHDPRDRSHHHHHNNNNNTARCGRGRHLSSHIEDINEPYGLREQEKGWRFFQPFLQKRGYELRPRYWPGWMGSWIGKNVDPLTCEDSIVVDSTVLDAVRISDNAQVILKVHTSLDPSTAHELDTLAYFSSTPSIANDPRNHCVPLWDILDVEVNGIPFNGVRISVMPLFRDWYAPRMAMVCEALSFVRQMLEGLEFMHSHNVAHCNISAHNILMDARSLYPQGFHGAFNMNPSHRVSESDLPHLTRLTVPADSPVKYHYIDFGYAVRFGSYEERRKVPWTVGTGRRKKKKGDGGLPELVGGGGGGGSEEGEGEALYDPFRGDVYALGRLFDHFFYKGHTGLEFLRPLFTSMTAPDPTARPTATQALATFHTLIAKKGKLKRMGRLGFRVRVSAAEWWENVVLYWMLVWVVLVGEGRVDI